MWKKLREFPSFLGVGLRQPSMRKETNSSVLDRLDLRTGSGRQEGQALLRVKEEMTQTSLGQTRRGPGQSNHMGGSRGRLLWKGEGKH